MAQNREKRSRAVATRTAGPSKRRFYLYVVIIGLLSLLIAPFLGQHYDPNVIAYAGVQVVNGVNPYGMSWWYSYDYPPLYLYYSSFVAFLLNDFPLNVLPEYRVPPLHLLLIKLPPVLSHLAIATTLYRSTSPRFPRFLPVLYLFSPFPFFISTIWGNIDELCAFFILLSMLSMYREKWINAGLMWGIACSLKIYVFLLLPIIPFLIVARKQQTSLKMYLSFLSTSFGVILLTSLPFLLSDFYSLISSLLWRLEFMGWAHDLGLSYGAVLSVLMQVGDGSTTLPGLIPLAVFGVFYLGFNLLLLKSRSNVRDFDEINKRTLALFLMAYLATTVVNEMNYVWALPLLLIYWSSRIKHVGRGFLILNLYLLTAVMVDWTPFDFIPGVDPSLVINYQLENQFRLFVMAGLGVGISTMVIIELLNIFKGFAHTRKRTSSSQPG